MAVPSNELIQAAQKAYQNYGVPVSVTLGFAGLETQYGTTGTGKSKNNPMGYIVNGKAMTFNNVEEAIDRWARLVTGNLGTNLSTKYGEATSKATSTYEWIDAIRETGYNSEYADGVYEGNIMKIVERDNLTQYDSNVLPLGSGTTSTLSVGTGNGVKWWGDIVIVVFSIILIIMGVAFLGLGVTSNGTGNALAKKVKKAVRK